jgi:hypothetical protein
MDYIETPVKPERVGRAKMPNKSITAEPKAAKKYAKTRGEHYKDIVIAVLIAGIIAFVGGMHFSNQQHSQTAQAVKNAIAPSVSAQAPAGK